MADSELSPKFAPFIGMVRAGLILILILSLILNSSTVAGKLPPSLTLI